MKHRTTQIIYSYWNEVRQRRLAPRRFDIEPARIAGILAETTILEQADDSTYRFRLAGTRITEQFGTELRGRNFLELWPEPDLGNLQHHLAAMKANGGVLVFTFEAETASGRTAVFEGILMPLVHTGDVVDRFLGAISCSSSPIWLGSQTLERFRLLSADTIWPDGRPHAIAERLSRTPALSPQSQNSRIVSLDRRRFRVFDGGRGPLDQGNR
jgi:hypothetical protein